jgi:hypothetical protein
LSTLPCPPPIGSHNWADRYPWIVETARKNRHQQFVIDGEAVVLDGDGTADFNVLRSRRHDEQVQLYAELENGRFGARSHFVNISRSRSYHGNTCPWVPVGP